MKKLVFLFLCIFAFTVSCVHYGKPQKAEIGDTLLEELSRDLAEINIMVENARKEYEKEELAVKVVEPWTKSHGLKFRIVTPSKQEISEVIAKSKVEIPLATGFETAEIFKAKGITGIQGKFIGVVTPEILGTIQASATKEFVIGGYPVKFYDAKLASDEKAIEAVMQYISFTSRIEKTADRILEKLVEIKLKYEKSPIYIDGFTIHLPLISVDVQFKFK